MKPLLDRLLAEPFFDQAPPKSTGRDLFDAAWLDARLRGCAASPQDVMATLAELTARGAVDALQRHAPATAVIAGLWRRRLQRAPDAAARGPAGRARRRCGAPPPPAWRRIRSRRWRFAWLARAHLARRPGNLPTATGARGPRVLGALYPAG